MLAQILPDQYFPPGVLGCGERLDGLLIDWYTKQLKALREPSLWTVSRSGRPVGVYRFLWLRSFHNPIAVRLVINPDMTGVVFVKVTSGKGGDDPGRLVRNESYPVGRHGTALLQIRLREANFWNVVPRGQPGGTDGAQWIVEGVSDGRYQVVDRWSPGESDPIHTLGLTFLTDLAGLRVAHDEL
jgi:hypothetical protein